MWLHGDFFLMCITCIWFIHSFPPPLSPLFLLSCLLVPFPLSHSLPPSYMYMCSPVRLLGGTTFRYMYCMIMGCWGANVIHDLFDQSLYFRSSNDLLDTFTYFGMPCSTIVCTNVHICTYTCTHVVYPWLFSWHPSHATNCGYIRYSCKILI